jgi:hypothetical protein
MGKDGDRRSDEDHREDDTAVTIDVLSLFRLSIALYLAVRSACSGPLEIKAQGVCA